MNEDVNQELNFMEPAGTKARKKSVTRIVVKYVGLLIGMFGVIVVFWTAFATASGRVKPTSLILVTFICFGICPLILGLLLSNTVSRKRSIKSFVIQYIGLLAVFIGVVHVTILCARILDEGTKDMFLYLTLVICWGLYPLVMGLVLRRHALNNNWNYRSGYLISMGFGVLMGWFVLMMSMTFSVAILNITIENRGWAIYASDFFFSFAWLFSGVALFKIGLRLGRDAEATPLPPALQDSYDTTHT